MCIKIYNITVKLIAIVMVQHLTMLSFTSKTIFIYTYRTLGPRRFGCHGGRTPCMRIRFGCKNIKCVTLETDHRIAEWFLPLAELSRTQRPTPDGLKQPFFDLNFFLVTRYVFSYMYLPQWPPLLWLLCWPTPFIGFPSTLVSSVFLTIS